MTDQAQARALMIRTDDALALASRRDVRRSNVHALVERNPDSKGIREEVRDLITSDFRRLLVEAAAGVSAELATADDRQHDDLVVHLTKAIALLGGSQTAEQRQEWISTAEEELEDYPWSLLAPAIAAARKRVTFSPQFVPTVIAAVEEPLARLKAEQEMIGRLLAIADGQSED